MQYSLHDMKQSMIEPMMQGARATRDMLSNPAKSSNFELILLNDSIFSKISFVKSKTETSNSIMYIQDVIDISARHKGPVFYEYHKAFANKVDGIKLAHG